MLWKDLFLVLFPKYCLGCDKVLLSAENYLCASCFSELEQMEAFNSVGHLYEKLFSEHKLFGQGTSLLYYEKETLSQKIIHQLKYKGNQEIGRWAGNWLAHKILKNNLLLNIDIVIPVPLHKKKKRKRGYNQVTLFGKMLAKALGAKYKEDILIRIVAGDTQTHKTKRERYLSVKNSFSLKNMSILASKNILIVDDVMTTGATLKACMDVLSPANPTSINIATIAYTNLKK